MLLAQLTDLHVCPMGVAANRVVETNTLVERALRMVSRMRPAPDAVILSGRSRRERPSCRVRSAGGAARAVSRLPGLRDPRQSRPAGEFSPALGHLPGVTSDPEFVQYAIEAHPVRLVMLDTLVPGGGYGRLSPGSSRGSIGR